MTLRHDNRLFEYFMSASKDLIFIKDCEHQYIKVNEVFLDLLNKSAEEVLGKSDLDLFPEDIARLHMALDAVVMKEEKSVENCEWITKANGERLYVEICKFPLYDESGKLIGIMGQSRDITQRKLMEDRLNERDQYLNGLIEGMEQGLAVHEIICDEKGIPCDYTFLEVNPQFERLTGLKRADLIGKRVLEVLPQTESYWIETYGRVAISGESIRYENKSSSIGKVFAVYAFRPKENQFAVLIEDVTQRKVYEEELIQERLKAEHANLAKDQFLANMSHEIRTPINGIIGLADLLRSTQLTSDQKLYLDMVKKSSLALVDVIQGILEYIGLTHTESNSVESPICISSLLAELNDLYAFSMKQKELDFTINQEPSCPNWLLGDALKIKQLLISLLGNALKFTHVGEVQLNVKGKQISKDSVMTVFEVKDTGIGISASVQESMFSYFEQGDSTTKKHYQGLGLGLSRVSELCRKLGADIFVDSQMGVGSAFRVHIPMKIIESPLSAQVESLESAQSKSEIGQQKTILIVEDDAVSRVFMELILKSMGYKVVSVEDGRSALDHLEAFPTDLIVLDLHLPEMDGFEVTGRIRSNLKEDIRQLPIVAVTSYANEANRTKGNLAGISDFLSKPVDKAQLIPLIDKWIRHK